MPTIEVEQPNNSHDEDDVSYDNSLSTTEISEEGKQQDTSTKGQIMSQISFHDGVSRVKSHWKVLVAGQVLSFLVALSGAMASSLYYECNISMPTTQAALIFLFMSFHTLGITKRKDLLKSSEDTTSTGRKIFSYGKDRKGNQKQGDDIELADLALGQSVSLDSRDLTRKNKSKSHKLFCYIPINVPWWVYCVFALVSVENTYLAFLAYRYTTFMSASLLDNFNIVAAMIASRLVLKRRYTWKHLLGAFICLAGVSLNIFSDFEKSEEEVDKSNAYAELEAEEYPHKVIGDIYALLGGILFGVCDVIIETIMKNFGGVDEYLGSVGIFGFAIAAIQAVIVERDAIAKFLSPDEISLEQLVDYDSPYDAPRTCSQNSALLLLLLFAIAGYLFNNGMSRFLTVSESALLVISILTADLWAVLFTVFEQHIMPSHFFFIAFILTIVGVGIYEMSPSPLGAAEDLQIHKEIELEKHHDPFTMSNISLSWESTEAADQKTKEIV